MDGIRREAVLAGLVTVAIHVVLVLLLPRLDSRPVPTPGRPLEAVFLLPPPRQHPVPASIHIARAADPTPTRAPDPPAAATRPDTDASLPEVAAAATAPAATRPLSAVYLQQARQWAAQQDAGSMPARDPLADRTAPVEPDGRFRMQRPKSVASAVASIGRLFGGADYGPDDCRRMSESITGLMAAGNTRGAQEAIDYERRYCRP